MAYDIYKARVNVYGITNKEIATNEGVSDFEYLLSNGDGTEIIEISDIEYTCVIEDKSSTKESGKDEKSLYCKFIDDIKIGDFFLYKDLNWLIIEKDIKTLDTYKKFFIHKCNQTYKILSSNGLIEYPCVARISSGMSSSIDDGKITSIQDYPYMISIQSNNETILTEENMRFIFGRNVYKVAKIEDSLTNGILYIYFEVDQKRPNDDFVNGIADNGDYSIEIDNGNVDNVIGYSTTLTAKVYRSGLLISPQPQIEWSSSDDLIATVDENGLLSLHEDGTSVIIAKFGNIEDSIEVLVQATPPIETISFRQNPLTEFVKKFDASGKTFTFDKYVNDVLSTDINTITYTITYGEGEEGKTFDVTVTDNEVHINNINESDTNLKFTVSDTLGNTQDFDVRLIYW